MELRADVAADVHYVINLKEIWVSVKNNHSALSGSWHCRLYYLMVWKNLFDTNFNLVVFKEKDTKESVVLSVAMLNIVMTPRKLSPSPPPPPRTTSRISLDDLTAPLNQAKITSEDPAQFSLRQQKQRFFKCHKECRDQHFGESLRTSQTPPSDIT
jgi:hypothetical protein